MKFSRRKGILALLLSLAFLLCTGSAALAADSSVTYGDGNVVAFAPGSVYTGTDLFDNFKGVMPGDVRQQIVTVKNQNNEFDYLKVYLRAVPHSEANQPQSGVTYELSNDFLSQLGMKVWNGTTLIYSDSPDEPDGLSTPVYLGQIAKNESITLKVELSVPITLGNEYAGRIGEVDWAFTFEGFDVDVLTARKVWTGDTENHPDSVQVQLLKNGEVFDTQTLSAANQWVYTWGGLDQDDTWDVQEVAIEGYTTTYTREGNDILITNDKPGEQPPPIEDHDVTVVKRWESGDQDHPNSVTITLYNGNTAWDQVTLSAANNWRHTWKDLDGEGQWSVVETNINGGYVPSYSTSGYVVTVTNTIKLVQTGQLSWPIPVLGGLGMLLIAYGLIAARKKRKDSHA